MVSNTIKTMQSFCYSGFRVFGNLLHSRLLMCGRHSYKVVEIRQTRLVVQYVVFWSNAENSIVAALCGFSTA